MERQEIVRRTWAELESELAAQGYELVEVEFGGEGGRAVLRLFIDRDGGVTIDDCANASRYVSVLLDKSDYIDGEYCLEVSSPGIERPIRKPSDFARFAGESVRLKTVSPIGGQKRFRGVLTGLEDGLVGVDDGRTVHRIHVENVKKARLDPWADNE